jgi:hypothetical protein
MSTSLSKGEIAPGKKIQIKADGLTPNSLVRLVMRSEPQVLTEAIADSNGSVVMSATIPTNIESGSHTLSVEATDSNGSPLLSVAAFSVDGDSVVTSVVAAGMVEELPNQQEISRSLSLERPIYNALSDPITTTVLVVGAVSLLGLAGSGGLGGSRLPSPNNGNSSPSPTAPAREENRKRAKLGSVVTKKLKAINHDDEGKGDQSETWRLFGGSMFELKVIQASAIGKYSPMLQRVFVDGAWIRAIFGSGGVIFWILGALLGLISSIQSQWTVVPLSWELLIAIVALSLLDASAGLMAWLTTVVLAALFGNITSWVDIRTALGLGICYFSLPLLAHAIRPLRRSPVDSTLGRFDRVADYVMPPVFVAFAGVSMIKALDGLSELKVTDATNHPAMRVCIILALILRLVGEDVVAHMYPKRMIAVQPAKLISSPMQNQLISLVIRTILFIAMVVPYFGFGVITIAAAILTLLPQFIKLWEEKLPNLVALNKWYPRGVLKFLIFLLIGTIFSTWLLGQDPSPERLQNSIPILLIPAFIGALFELLGRDGGKWEFEWPKRIAGLIVWASAVGLVTGVLVIG